MKISLKKTIDKTKTATKKLLGKEKMSEDEVRESVTQLISEVTEIDKKKIKLDSKLVADLELESLDVVNLISAAEEKYNITIPDADIKNFQTVGDIVEFVTKYA